jgi:hypothetical protein
VPHGEEDSYAFVSDIFGGIIVAVMTNTTIGTVPETIRKRKLRVAMTTARAQLRRRKPAVNKDKVAVVPSSFVLNLTEGFTVRGVVDRFGKAGFDMPFRFSVSQAIVSFVAMVEIEN